MEKAQNISRIAADTLMGMLIRHEEAVEQLYRLYAERFPKMQPFWNHIAAQEKGHAVLLRQLVTKLQEGKLHFSTERFNLETIRVSAEFVENQIAIAKRDPITELDALTTAMRTEDQSIEANAFGMFQEPHDDHEVGNLFTRIHDQELQHRAFIENKISEFLTPPQPPKKGLFRRIFGK